MLGKASTLGIPSRLGLGALGLALGVHMFFCNCERYGDQTRVDGLVDFATVPPEQLCPSAKKDYQVQAT